MLLWLCGYSFVEYNKTIFTATKTDLLRALALKLETTNNHYSDIFVISTKAAGNKITRSGGTRRKKSVKQLPKAGFDAMAAFIGAM